MNLRNGIDATDLNLWACRRDSQDKLPLLIRRLVHATITKVDRIGFPAGDSVQMGGWDGILTVSEGNEFAPDGLSVWEMGATSGIKGKADGDYEKRTADPKDVDPTKATFVFVTPRRWGNKEKWVRERNAEGKWAEVRAYDADDLEHWLELAPAVQAWFARLLGRLPDGAEDLEYRWEKWRDSTNPPMGAELSLAGRQEATIKLLEWLSGEPSALSVQGESREEVVAFVAAALEQLPQEQRIVHFSRALVVVSADAWRQLAASNNSLLLVPMHNAPDGIGNAVRRGHHVLLPLGKETTASKQALLLPRAMRRDFEQALASLGFDSDRARTLTTSTRRSLLVFRRKIAHVQEVHQPSWAEPDVARQLIPILLMGGWSGLYKPDKLAVEQLACRTYDQVNEEMLRWVNVSDPPVRRIDEVWQLSSREDAWALLARYITKSDLDAFVRVSLTVLGTSHPRYELPPKDRWAAEVYNKRSLYSTWLEQGLVETLAMLGARAEHLERIAEDKVRSIVSQLLNPEASWQQWASLARHMPLLAEANPDAFLSAVEKALRANKDVLTGLFVEEGIMGSSPHTYLLWALETLAWEPKYLRRVSMTLTQLAALDPGGKLLNRPIKSLAEIFLPWHPQTTASLEQRLRVLGELVERQADIGWQLLVALLPSRGGGTAMGTCRPVWRDWVSEHTTSVKISEYQLNIEKISERVLSLVGTNASRWGELLQKIDVLPPIQREKALEALVKLNWQEFPETARAEIRSQLGDQIGSHRKFVDAEWAMPPEVVDKLQETYDILQPSGALEECLRLFARARVIPELAGIKDHQERRSCLEAMQSEAIHRLREESGIVDILELANRITQPRFLGYLLGLIEGTEQFDDQVFDACFMEGQRNAKELMRGFVGGRSTQENWEWAAQTLRRRDCWSPSQASQFGSYLRFGEDTWNLMAELDKETECNYWRQVDFYWSDDHSACQQVVERLLEVERPFNAVDAAVHCIESHKSELPLPTPVLVAILLRAAECWKIDEQNRLQLADLDHYIECVFSVLDTSKDLSIGELEQLEWVYLPVLKETQRQTHQLQLNLANNPEYFVQLLRILYKQDDGTVEKNEQPPEVQKAECERARLLLDSWRTLPGLGQEKCVQEELVKSWANRARDIYTAEGRRNVGDSKLGEMLARLPEGGDGVWPHPAVRDLVEQFESEHFECGLDREKFNRRGVHWREVDAGGKPERELSTEFRSYSIAVQDEWPRTAAMLEGIAQFYERDAVRGDKQRELDNR